MLEPVEKPKSKREGLRRETLALILATAERIFADHGFKGATMQAIADGANLPKANLHYYFPTKQDLYRQVVERIFNIWLDAAESFDTQANPEQALGTYIRKKMEISRSHPYGSKVWANEVMHGAPIIHDYLETTLAEWTESRIEVIERWEAEGLIDPVNPRHLLYMIWSTTQHYADFSHQIATLNNGVPFNDAQWAEATDCVTSIILKGIGVMRVAPS